MMSLGGATLILLPVVFLLRGATWAATLGGFGGESNQQGGGKQKSDSIVGDDDEVDLI